MKPYPMPSKEGHFWGKLVHPCGLPKNENWESIDWEVILVFDNNGEGMDKLRALVAGVRPSQPLDAFVWGPEVMKPKELE